MNSKQQLATQREVNNLLLVAPTHTHTQSSTQREPFGRAQRCWCCTSDAATATVAAAAVLLPSLTLFESRHKVVFYYYCIQRNKIDETGGQHANLISN